MSIAELQLLPGSSNSKAEGGVAVDLGVTTMGQHANMTKDLTIRGCFSYSIDWAQPQAFLLYLERPCSTPSLDF